MKKTALLLLIFIIQLSACSNNNSRYLHKNDSTPSRLPSASQLIDATPRSEPHSRGGNKNYTVLGKHYKVLKNAENFQETGIASWYGRKFHGHLTSNGEIYDMYAMSAAHKNLPLPTYVKVTNNSNGRTVIVRVNDRGPFHQNRVIDLSYSAAYKLDILKTGTAKVTITAITDINSKNVTKALPIKEKQRPPQKTDAEKTTARDADIIQVFATKNTAKAQEVISSLAGKHKINARSQQLDGIFRVIVSPIDNNKTIQQLLFTLKHSDFPNAFIRKGR